MRRPAASPAIPIVRRRPARSSAATQRAPGKLRVAFMRKPVGDGPLDPVLVAAVERTAKMLEGLGHHVEEAAPDYDAAAIGAAFWHGDVRQHLDQHPAARRRPRAGSGRSRAGDAPSRRDRAGRQRRRVHPRRPDLPPHRPPARRRSSRSTTCCCRPRSRARTCRSARSHGRHARAVSSRALAPMIAVHRGVQRHRRAGHVGAARMDRRRPADRHALRRPLRGGGDAVLARRPTRKRRAVAGPPATGR